MSRDHRLALLVNRNGSPLESLIGRFEVTFSGSARERYDRFNSISVVFRSALDDADEKLAISIPSAQALRAQTLTMLLLLILLVVIVLEYRSYTMPTIFDWLHIIEHHCGIS